MANFSDVDMNGVEPQDDFSPIPAGEYLAMIVASEIKNTKDFSGKYIKIEAQIIDGEYKNRKLFSNLNLWNKNDQAVAIAKRELESIRRAVNLPAVTDTGALHNKHLIVRVGIRPASDGYDAQNIIKAWLPRQQVPAEPAPVRQAAPAATSGKPWERPASPIVTPPPPTPDRPDIF